MKLQQIHVELVHRPPVKEGHFRLVLRNNWTISVVATTVWDPGFEHFGAYPLDAGTAFAGYLTRYATFCTVFSVQVYLRYSP